MIRLRTGTRVAFKTEILLKGVWVTPLREGTCGISTVPAHISLPALAYEIAVTNRQNEQQLSRVTVWRGSDDYTMNVPHILRVYPFVSPVDGPCEDVDPRFVAYSHLTTCYDQETPPVVIPAVRSTRRCDCPMLGTYLESSWMAISCVYPAAHGYTTPLDQVYHIGQSIGRHVVVWRSDVRWNNES